MTPDQCARCCDAFARDLHARLSAVDPHGRVARQVCWVRDNNTTHTHNKNNNHHREPVLPVNRAANSAPLVRRHNGRRRRRFGQRRPHLRRIPFPLRCTVRDREPPRAPQAFRTRARDQCLSFS